MAFNTQEQEIIKYGVQNGKSKQEVEQAISNYRAGIVPKKKVETAPVQTEPSLGTKLVDRATTFGKEALALGTLGASTVSSQDIQETKTSPEQRNLIGLEAFNRAFQAPAKMAMAAGGAVGDIVGAGLQATGLDKAIGDTLSPAVSPVVKSEGARKLVDNFHKLPQDTQDYLKGIPDIANLIGIDVIPSAISKATAKTSITGSAFDVIKGSTGNLTTKALDFISADPSAKVETILKRSTPQELDNYLSIAEQHASSQESKHVFEVVGDKLAETTKTLDSKLKEIGRAKSEIVTPLREGLGAFKNETTPFIEKLTSLKNNFSEIDKGQKSIVQAIINDAKTVSTKRDADMFIDKVQNALYTGNMDMTIPRGSSLDKQLRGMLGEYNTSLKKSLPTEYTQLNEQYSKLIDTLDVINRSLGETVEGVPIRGASLIKQFFSPSGSKAKEIFEFIKKETNGEVDLAKDATLAKFAGQLYDDPNVNSLLGGIKDIPTTAGAIAGKVIEKVGGKQVTEALRSSTVKKAKSSTLPVESKAASMVDKKMPIESKLVSSPQSTPTTTKGKGIKLNAGFANFGEIKKAITPRNESNMSKKAVDAIAKSQKIEIPEEVIAKANKFTPKQLNMTELFLSDPKNSAYNEDFRKMIGYEGFDSEMSQQKLEVLASQLKESIGLNTKKKVVSEIPETVKIWNKSKFSNDGAYADIPVIRREDNITLYQGGSDGKRQFWTPDRKYAEKFGEVKSKTGSFYKVDNGNRVTDVYVEVPTKAPSLEQEAKKYKSAEEFVKAQKEIYHGGAGVDALKNNVNILSPEEKLKMPSSGGGNIGLSTTDNKNYAIQYSQSIGGRNDVATLYINPKAKIYDIGNKHIDEFSSDELTKLAEKYDVIKSSEENEYRIITKNGAVTKSQLTDIWNKAHGK